MSDEKTRIVLKLTGHFLTNSETGEWDSSRLITLIKTIKEARNRYQFGIVMGGGNIFRGKKEGAALSIAQSGADRIGILATMINSLILYDICKGHDLSVTLFSALTIPSMGTFACPDSIGKALIDDHVLIFMGGLAVPFFTTDTTAVVRALQMNASQVWKISHIDGIYSDDPVLNPDAHFYKQITYKKAIDEKLAICDATALALASQHTITLRVFDGIHTENALNIALDNPTFGSTIIPS